MDAVAERREDLIKPNNDARLYRGLVLSNRLKVVLVSDPSTDKSAASLSVRVGSLFDPVDKQGMAHLLEHALFISSKKYPEENFFKNYIVQNGGHTNAFTGPGETTYFFDVDPNVLEPALERFVQFFIDPLFPEDKIEKEIQSVQFEFENTLTSDRQRIHRIRKKMGNQKHDYAKFEIGNRDTLQMNENLHLALVQFYHQFYSANVMSLAVFGKESLDRLEEMTVPLFSKIINRDVEPYYNAIHPYSAPFCQKKINIVPFQEMRKMIIFFPMPDPKQEQEKWDALNYITHLLGHEGPGSLLSRLKTLHYSSMLDAMPYFYPGFGFLDIEVDLNQGVIMYDKILLTIFQYIKLLKSKPPSQSLYEEIKLINTIKFHNRDKYDPIHYARYLSANLSHHLSMERVICGRCLMGPFNQQTIIDTLNLITVDTVNVIMISPIFKTQYKNLSEDTLYKVQYIAEGLIPSLLESCRVAEPTEHLHFPFPNEYIPNDLALKTKPSSESKVPELIVSTDRFKVWHLQDQQYCVPKVFFGFAFKSHLVNSTPGNWNITNVALKCFADSVEELFYSALLAGISYNIFTNIFGLEIMIQGFNDKLDKFVYDFFRELLKFKVNANRYTIFYDIYTNQIKTYKRRPVTTLLHHFQEHISSCVWSFDELIEAIPEVTIDSVSAMLRNIISHSVFETLVHGNVTAEQAKSVSQNVYELLVKSSSLFPLNPLVILERTRDVQFAYGATYQYAVSNEFQENHGLLVYFQVGTSDLELRAKLELLNQVMALPYFNQIRMSEQLAYVAFLTPKYTFGGTIGLAVTIQSAFSLQYLQVRIDAFLNYFEEFLSKLTSQEFEQEKRAIITKLTEKPKIMFTQSFQFWAEVVFGYYLFERRQKLVLHVQAITEKEAILQMFKDYIQKGGIKRRRLIITILATKCNTKEAPCLECSKVQQEARTHITNVRKFKCESCLAGWPFYQLGKE